MTLADLIADSKDRIAEGSSEFFKDSTWKRWLNEAQRAVVRQTQVLERSATSTIIAEQRSYQIGDDFWKLHLVQFNGETLHPVTPQEVFNRGHVVGTPYSYALWGSGILLHPSPANGGELFVLYYAWPTPMEDLTDTPDIPEAFHGLLPTFAAYRAKMADQMTAEADRLYLEFQQGVSEAISAFTDRQDQVMRVRDVADSSVWGLWE